MASPGSTRPSPSTSSASWVGLGRGQNRHGNAESQGVTTHAAVVIGDADLDGIGASRGEDVRGRHRARAGALDHGRGLDRAVAPVDRSNMGVADAGVGERRGRQLEWGVHGRRGVRAGVDRRR